MEVAKVKLKVRDNVAGNFIYYSAFSLLLSLFLSLYFSSLSWSISSMPFFSSSFSLYSPHFLPTLIVFRQAMERGWEQAFPSGTGQGGGVQVIIISPSSSSGRQWPGSMHHHLHCSTIVIFSVHQLRLPSIFPPWQIPTMVGFCPWWLWWESVRWQIPTISDDEEIFLVQFRPKWQPTKAQNWSWTICCWYWQYVVCD